MFDEWKFERKLRQLQNNKRKIAAYYLSKHQEAKKRDDREELRSIAQVAGSESDMAQDAIDRLVTDYIKDQAERYLVELPFFDTDNNVNWRVAEYTMPRSVLTPSAVRKIRDDIHQEIKKKWERRFIWLQPISILISLSRGLVACNS